MVTAPHSHLMQDRDLRANRRMIGSRAFWIAVFLSFGIHFAFYNYSQQWVVSDISRTEENVETLFQVQFRDLESENFMSRPTQQHMQEERARVLQEQVQEIAARPIARAADSDIASGISALEQTLPPPVLDPDASAPPMGDGADPQAGESDGSSSDSFPRDQGMTDIISTDDGSRAVEDFEEMAASNAVADRVAENRRIPLTGRGRGTQNRILATLPTPANRTDPVVSRSLGTVLNRVLAPAAPNLDIAQPPIEIPPVNEILPSPELLRPSLSPTTLKREEEAMQQIKDRYIRLDDLLDVQLFTYHHLGGEGYFMIRIRPIAQDDRLRILPKDVVFVLDVSGSMGERRLTVIKKEVRSLIQRLRPEDRFNVVGFRQDIKKFARTLSPVNEQALREVWKFINPLEASGRTDIYSSLQPLVQLGTERARPLIMLLYSDGRPNVGVVNSRKIINNLSKFLGPSTSIYCVGTGDTINRYLLDMLAFRNRGMVAFEKDRTQLPDVMQSVYGYVEDPVLLKVQASFEGIDAEEIYPKKLPDLYLKGELRIWGRLKDEKNVTVRIVGEAFDEKKEMIKQLEVPEMDNATYEIAREWAFHKAYDRVGQMVEEGENDPKLVEEIRTLSRTYRIGTPYSAESGIKD